MNKAALRDAIIAQLRADLAQQTAAAQLSRDEAISEESRPENKYDTHSQEAAYLAEGQARLAKEIAENIGYYATLPLPGFAPDAAVDVGTLVAVSGGRATTWYFVGPRAGGLEVTFEGHDVLVITPVSPLGRQLMGKRVGAIVQLPGRGGEVRIQAVA